MVELLSFRKRLEKVKRNKSMMIEASKRAFPTEMTTAHPLKSPKTQAFEGVVMYYGYRFYDPETGRWPSRDPLGEMSFFDAYASNEVRGLGLVESEMIIRELEDESRGNIYAFLRNAPLNAYDKHGLGRKIVGAMIGHWSVVIDKWKYNKDKCCYEKDGAYQYDFGPWYQGAHWLLAPAAFTGTFPGAVFRTESEDTGMNVSGPLQDIAAHEDLSGLLPYGNAPAYHVIGNNCQHMALYFMEAGMDEESGKECL